MVFSVSNVVEDRTWKVGWVASVPARGRVRLVDQPNIKWLNELHTADSMYPPRAMYSIRPAPVSFPRAYFEAGTAVVLFPASRTPTYEQVCHISCFLIACAIMFRMEKTTMAVVV